MALENISSHTLLHQQQQSNTNKQQQQTNSVKLTLIHVTGSRSLHRRLAHIRDGRVGDAAFGLVDAVVETVAVEAGLNDAHLSALLGSDAGNYSAVRKLYRCVSPRQEVVQVVPCTSHVVLNESTSQICTNIGVKSCFIVTF